MKNYNDKEINRLLAEADDLLSGIQLYETPEEEQERKKKEELQCQEELRKQQEEMQRQEEMKQQEELQRQEELQEQAEQQRQEELQRQAELQKQAELQRQEKQQRQAELQQQETQLRQEEWQRQKELQRQEVSQEQEERQKQEALQQWEEQQRQQENFKFQEEPLVQEQKQKEKKQEKKQGKMQQQDRHLPVFGILFLILSFAFMELITHLSLYRSVDTTFLYPALFAAGMGCVTAIVVSFFNKRINTILAILVMLLYGGYCDLQILYHAAFGNFLRLVDMRDGVWMLIHNRDIVLSATETVLPWLVLMVLPIILWAVLGRKVICFEKGNWLNRMIITFAGGICIILGILLLDIHGYEIGSPYVCFYHFDSLSNLGESGQQLGMLGTLVLEWMEWF